MKRLTTLVLATALAMLPLTSCNDGGGARPLAKPSSDIPEDDGKVFRPDGPIVAPPADPDPGDQGKKARSNIDDPDAKDPGGSNNPNSPVPEPTTLLIVGSGLAGVAILRRRKRAEDLIESDENVG